MASTQGILSLSTRHYSSFYDVVSSTNITKDDILRRNGESQAQWKARLDIQFTFANDVQWEALRIKDNEEKRGALKRIQGIINNNRRRAKRKAEETVKPEEKKQKFSTSPALEDGGSYDETHFVDASYPHFVDASYPCFVDASNPRFVDASYPRFVDASYPPFLTGNGSGALHDFATECRGSFMEAASKTIEWRGTNGTNVLTCAPTVLDAEGANLLETEAVYLSKVAEKYGLVESNTEDIIFLHPPHTGFKNLHLTLRDAVARNKVVVIRQAADPLIATARGIDANFLQAFGFPHSRAVEIHDSVKKIPTLIFNTNDEEEGEGGREEAMSIPPDVALPSTIETFLKNLENPKCLQFILDLPCSYANLPLDSWILDDVYKAYDNTPQFKVSQNWRDKGWALLHHAGTFTPWHHDADGKATLIFGERGAKMWSYFHPFTHLAKGVASSAMEEVCRRPFRLPSEEMGRVSTILILPGDLVIQPPGIVHQVYTPIPSFFRGSSFWIFESLHLSEMSRRIDAQSGHFTTNVEHKDADVLASMYSLVLYLALDVNVRYRRPLLALFTMILSFLDYVKIHPPHEKELPKTKKSLLRVSYRAVVVGVIREVCKNSLFLPVGSTEEELMGVVQKALDTCPRWASIGEELLLDSKSLIEQFPKFYTRTEKEESVS